VIKIDRSAGNGNYIQFLNQKEWIPMIVKEVLSEELLTLAEVKEILFKIAEERREQGIEVGYGFRKALRHADQFSKISGEKSRELINKLLKLEKMKPIIAVRIADILPQSRDEIRSIYAKEKYTLSNEELDLILDYVMETIE
jgi:DNA-directed RNA polymerase subunit F